MAPQELAAFQYFDGLYPLRAFLRLSRPALGENRWVFLLHGNGKVSQYAEVRFQQNYSQPRRPWEWRKNEHLFTVSNMRGQLLGSIDRYWVAQDYRGRVVPESPYREENPPNHMGLVLLPPDMGEVMCTVFHGESNLEKHVCRLLWDILIGQPATACLELLSAIVDRKNEAETRNRQKISAIQS